MKKIAMQFAAYFLVVACLFLLAGRSDGWIEPPEEGPSSDIVLAGTKFNGKVVVNITIHPDGTLEHEGNGTVTEGTWEPGTGDVAMIAHFPVKDANYDMDIYDMGSSYSAKYPLVDLELTGRKPVKPIILSGEKYSGKVVVKVTLNPDGTGEHEGNGDVVPATWEKGDGDVAMVVHFNVKGTDYEMNVLDDGNIYTADYPIVAEMKLTGSKGETSDPAETEASTEVPTEAATEAPTETAAQTAPAAEEAPVLPDNTFILDYVADINEQLTGHFTCEPSVWEAALGTSGSYVPTDSEDILFSWTKSGKSKEMDFFANGTYEFRYTSMGVAEQGTWTYENGELTITSAAGKEYAAEKFISQPAATEPAPAAEAPEYPDNTFILDYVADINEQLTGHFTCEPSVWEAALGTSGSYVPTDSEDILFSWTKSGKSKEMDFFANGTYEFRYTSMGVAEQGTWTYENGELTITSAAGRVMTAIVE